MVSSVVVSSTTFQSWRERSPSSYSLKIQNFSQLKISTPFSEEKYRSYPFSSGGYNWRMMIYPKGNEKDEGSGFISMYVEIDTPSLMSKSTTEVFADLRFFVFNRKENKYFVIQYIESKPFNIVRTVWGIPQMLPCDTFNDPKNGYIFEEHECEFGVDVIVSPPPTNWEILSFSQKHNSTPKFSWSLKNFSKLKDKFYKSNSFSMGARKWHLKLYPNGDLGADGKWLSIYLCVSESETTKEDEKIFVQAILRVVDPRGSNHSTHHFNSWCIKSNLGRGYSQFVALADLPKTYLDEEDTLNVEIEFGIVSETKDSLPLSN